MLITAGTTLGVSVGKPKLLLWLGVAVALLIKFAVVPMIPTIALADAYTRHIPLWLAPLNWALFLALVAVCEGPLLMPKYLSVPLNILWAASFLFLLGSWQFHRFVSPSVVAIAYVEMNWLIPRWETKWIDRGRRAVAVSPNATILKIAVMADGRITMDGSPTTINSLRMSLKRLADQKGAVWYYREAGQGAAPPESVEIMEAVVENHLPIRLSSRPDYSDAIGSDGRPVTA
jgi:4-amino-4-deoxy-L-arabinose transferase-like glycosyltransferase